MFCLSRLLLVLLDLQLIFKAASWSEGFANRNSLSGAHGHIATSEARVEAVAAQVTAEGGVQVDTFYYGNVNGETTLKEYCEGDENDFYVGNRVEACWLGLGVHYLGRVKKLNDDGTLDVFYDDGWVEMNVPKSRVRKVKNPLGVEGVKRDAACELKDLINKVKDASEDAFMDVAATLATKKEEEVQAETFQSLAPAPAPAPSPAAASAGARMTPAEQEEVRVLEERLKQLHGKIGILKEETAENREQLKDFPGAAQTYENPILKDYRWQVAEESERLRNLEREKAKQEKQLAVESAKKDMQLPRLMNNTRKLQEDLDLLREKREEFHRTNRLDPELRFSIDTLLKQQKRVMDNIKKLSEATKRAQETKEALSGGETTAEAAGKQKVADHELQLAAEAVGRDLRSVSKEAHQLDTGVHPHGEKWWRYRYEHNYVESCIMIVLLTFMMIYETLIFWFRLNVLVHSSASLQTLFTTGTLYTKWIEQLLVDLAACLLVTLTVWAVFDLGGFYLLNPILAFIDVGPLRIHHLPTCASEYKAMAVRGTVVLSISMLMYSILSFAVVRQAMKKITNWADRAQAPLPVEASPTRIALRERTAIGLAWKGDDFWKLLAYFQDQGFAIEPDEFWKYLRYNVTVTIQSVFTFGVRDWCGFLLSFVVLTVLHRTLKIDYMAVMVFFFNLLVVWIIFFFGIVQYLRHRVEAAEQPETGDISLSARIVMKMYEGDRYFLMWLRPLLGSCLQYNLFFLCFGMARLVSTQWLWELHFERMLGLAGMLVLCGVGYIVFGTPVIPTVAATLALPPYIDEEHVEKIKSYMKSSTSAEEFLKSSAIASKISWFLPYTTLRDWNCMNPTVIETLAV